MWGLPARVALSTRVASWRTIRGVARKAAPMGFATGVVLLMQPKSYVHAETVATVDECVALTTSVVTKASADLTIPAELRIDRLKLIRRAFVLMLRWAPVIVLSPLLWIRKEWWWNLVMDTIENCGPCFVKLAQWASMRQDFLPPHLCERLSAFHYHCRIHSWEHTLHILRCAFGPTWERHLHLNPNPVGSGAVAQVYRGTLTDDDGNSSTVAVKVCHPHAREQIEIDLSLLACLASGLEVLFPSIKVLSGPEMVSQFCAFMRAQMDMRIEARNLDRFNADFEHAEMLRFPRVKRPWVASDVLVESFEDAHLVSDHLFDRSKLARTYSASRKMSWPHVCGDDQGFAPTSDMSAKEFRRELGEKTFQMFLTMLFDNNFLHGDLHPGNVMYTHMPISLIVLDCGLCIDVTRRDARNFADVLIAFMNGDGKQCGRLLIERTPGDRSRFLDEDVFIEGVAEIVSDFHRQGLLMRQIRFAPHLGKLLRLVCRHHVVLEPNFVNIVLSITVCEGFAIELAPEMNLFQKMTPYLLRASARSVFNQNDA
eukprot:GEMP01004883.1.p1 GENE.GEMP01004883.1~~GEMP01004883.1.p1  ORF type:complete len:541 (+),score=94.69 GEMP01004883.1:54-1676(+)